MLDSLKFKMWALYSEKGTTILEYVIILAFVAVVAIGLSPEWSQDFDAFQNNEFKPNNVSTGVRWVLFKVRGLLGYAGNMESYH